MSCYDPLRKQLAVVQFGTRSMSSTAVESGNMLDIKTMCPLTEGTLNSPRLLPAGLLCRTMAEASARREAFLAGAEVCETKREVCSSLHKSYITRHALAPFLPT